jgi:RNA pseudouridylate synthase
MIRCIVAVQRFVLECRINSKSCRNWRSKSLKNLVSSVLPLFLSSASHCFTTSVVVRGWNSQQQRRNRSLAAVQLQDVSHFHRLFSGCALNCGKDDDFDENETAFNPLSLVAKNDTIKSPPLPMIHSRTEFSFATHVLITTEEAPISVVEVVQRVLSTIPHEDKSDLSAIDLIQLGSVWYLCAEHVEKHGTFNPSSGVKPTRLLSHISNDGSDIILYSGDYLRIHHNPRRFHMVHNYHWSGIFDSELHSSLEPDEIGTVSTMMSGSERDTIKPGVIVGADLMKGWIVLYKPAGIPVHMTVDNALENVASCLKRAMISSASLDSQQSATLSDVYVATPQRLDQNTSGLLVVATSKTFASYFAQLLRYKTAELLIQHENLGSNLSTSACNATDATPMSSNGTAPTVIGGVHKLYRCLVCIIPPVQATDTDSATQQAPFSNWSIQKAASVIHSYVRSQQVIRHFLEPSIRAPKRFVLEKPAPVMCTNDTSSLEANEWPEALLRIRKASNVYNLTGSAAALDLAQSLWSSDANSPNRDGSASTTSHNVCSIPDNCQGVMELEVELLTGRTHQIRGQLAACHFPLVGDVQYGGAKQPSNCSKPSLITERLALQCCALEFVDPDIATDKPQRDGTYPMVRSERWNRFRLKSAWWTPLLDQFDLAVLGNATKEQVPSDFGTRDRAQVSDVFAKSQTAAKLPRPQLLPQRVSLSRGRNKYILIRAVHPAIPTQEEWFVKSASPKECGGPYHGKSLFYD